MSFTLNLSYLNWINIAIVYGIASYLIYPWLIRLRISKIQYNDVYYRSAESTKALDKAFYFLWWIISPVSMPIFILWTVFGNTIKL